MADSILFGGVQLYNATSYKVTDGAANVDWGIQAVSQFLLTGDYRPEEYDQVCAEQGALRPVRIPLRVYGTSKQNLVANLQALTSILGAANRFNPTSLVYTPNGGTASTFQVVGGSLDAPFDIYTDHSFVVKDAVLNLLCLPFVYGPLQTGAGLGTQGSPLASNAQSPVMMQVTPNPIGDVPGDVTIFVKNRSIITQTVQFITVSATNGTFKLKLGSSLWTGSIAYNAASTVVLGNLQSVLGSSGIAVSGPNGGPWTVTFSGPYAYNKTLLSSDASLLSGGSHSVTINPIGTTPTPIRSLIVGCVSQNTTWQSFVGAGGWTSDTYGDVSGSQIVIDSSAQQNAVSPIAHFTAPTLPSDRRFRLYLQAGQALNGGEIEFRVRIVSGSTQATGEWRSLPQEFDSPSMPYATAAVDMGAWTFPVGEVGQLGAGGTTIYIEARLLGADTTQASVSFQSALFVPDDSMLLCETEDTTLALEASGSYIRVESDNVYDSAGNPLGPVTTGSHVRSQGGDYLIYTSQGFTDTIDPSLPWQGEPVDVWASYTPRYIGLAP